MLSPKMTQKILEKGHVGTRIAWVRLRGPVCNLFYIVVYIPHKGRVVKPRAEDTIRQLANLLQKVKKSDCVVIAGGFNCQLQRSVQGCTGKWCMTRYVYENKKQRTWKQDKVDLITLSKFWLEVGNSK